MSELIIDSVWKEYGDQIVLENVSLTVAPRAFVHESELLQDPHHLGKLVHEHRRRFLPSGAGRRSESFRARRYRSSRSSSDRSCGTWRA